MDQFNNLNTGSAADGAAIAMDGGRKRLRDGNAGGGGGAAAPSCVLKILVSNSLAGSIIGRGGASIRKLQQDCGAKVNLSQGGRFFPGTEDRVVMIEGTMEQVSATQAQIVKLLQSEACAGMEGGAASAGAAARTRPSR